LGAYPQLAIVRVGEREDAIAYEHGAIQRCEQVGVCVRLVSLPEQVTQDELLEVIAALNADASVHGILLLRPLPAHLDSAAICDTIVPGKDVDGVTNSAATDIFTGQEGSFAPCTAQACMELLDYYGIAVQGRKLVVVGRSLVVGKPVAMMLLARDATVTVAHSRTADLAAVVREAEIIIACAGRAKLISVEHLRPGHVVIDVGINVDEMGRLVGDVDYEAALAVVDAISPVPGGVGAITTSVLAYHVAQAAQRLLAG